MATHSHRLTLLSLLLIPAVCQAADCLTLKTNADIARCAEGMASHQTRAPRATTPNATSAPKPSNQSKSRVLTMDDINRYPSETPEQARQRMAQGQDAQDRLYRMAQQQDAERAAATQARLQRELAEQEMLRRQQELIVAQELQRQERNHQLNQMLRDMQMPSAPAKAAAPIPATPGVLHCNDAGCSDDQGNWYRQGGNGNYWGPNGSCQERGGMLYCQ